MNARLPAPERRRQLLAVATQVFGTVGFHDASMADIAAAAGVTKPVLYQHFVSKEHLYRETVVVVGQRMRDEIGKATTEATTPHDQVERGFAAFASFLSHDRAGFRVLFSDTSRADPELATEVHEVEDAVADQIAELIDIAGVPDEDRRVLAHALVGMAEGASRYWDREGRRITPDQLARLLTQLAWTGLRGTR